MVVTSGFYSSWRQTDHGVAWSVCLFVVTFVSPAKTAEPIEMPFAGMGQVGQRTMC